MFLFWTDSEHTKPLRNHGQQVVVKTKEKALYLVDAIKKKYNRNVYFSEQSPRDLHVVFNSLNAEYFNNSIDASIRWGRPIKSKWGYYQFKLKRITINQILREDWVPLEVLRFIVYHEMLHHVCRPFYYITSRGKHRRKIHTPEFNRREALYPSYDFCEKWLKENSDVLAPPEQRSEAIAQTFDNLAKSVGLDPNKKKFMFRGKEWTILGLKTSYRKYPIIAQNAAGRKMRFAVRDVQSAQGLGPYKIAPWASPELLERLQPKPKGLSDEELKRWTKHYGMANRRTVTKGNKTYEIVGFEPSRWKYPVQIRDVKTGREYKARSDDAMFR